MRFMVLSKGQAVAVDVVSVLVKVVDLVSVLVASSVAFQEHTKQALYVCEQAAAILCVYGHISQHVFLCMCVCQSVCLCLFVPMITLNCDMSVCVSISLFASACVCVCARASTLVPALRT